MHVDREALNALPPSLRSELAGAIVSLDAEKISEAIQRVSALKPDLGAALRQHADRKHYTAILQAVQDN